MSKAEILEAYLTFAPYGGNIEGVEAASMAYFGHSARELSSFEIAWLVSVPQDPEARYPAAGHAKEITNAVAKVAHRLRQRGVLDNRQLALALAGKPTASLIPFPREAMHAATYIASRTSGARVRSTIRRDAQKLVEATLASYRVELHRMGIGNAAAIVIDNDSSSVTAAVGSLDFFDEARQGQVIGFAAPRSPGSAMKPFIYAMAIDRGLALPDFLVADAPVNYSGYRPINYDRRFRGLVRLEDALSKSLNIPFINLTRKVGVPEVVSFLGEAGVTGLRPEPGFYGLSIAVGAADVSLLELTNMYAMLDRGGEYEDPAWTGNDIVGRGKRLLSPGAAYLTRRALSIKDRPDFPGRRRATGAPPSVFWKTGTSSRHRDAWALGGNGRYTAGVWCGNFDGKPSNDLVGSERSGPILFDILDGLPNRAGDDPVPPDLVEIEVCAFSGRPAGPYCPEKHMTLALADRVPRETCPYHQRFLVDSETGFRVDPMCGQGRETERRVFTTLPASVSRWIADRQLLAAGPPPFAPWCEGADIDSDGPRITSPSPDAVYFLVAGMDVSKQEIPLEANAGAGAGELYWFVDGKLVSSTAPRSRAWLIPEPGRHEVRVLDAMGRGHGVKITVLPPG